MTNLAEDNEVTQLLSEILAAARAGRIQGVVIVMSPLQENFNVRLAGSNPCALHAGCAKAQELLMAAMTAPAPPKQTLVRASAIPS